MPIPHGDWRAIQDMVSGMIEGQGEYFVQDIVVKSDQDNKIIWTKEFGDQAIPLFTFDYQVKYYDSDATSASTTGGIDGPWTTTISKQRKPYKTRPYTKEVEVLVPRIGDVVLIARHLGARRLPKCLGVLKSKNFISEGES
jgi:hypothetical protein